MTANDTPGSSSKKRAADHDDGHGETSASKRLKNGDALTASATPAPTTPTPAWANKTSRPAAYDEDLAPPKPARASQQDLIKSRAIKQLKNRKGAVAASSTTAKMTATMAAKTVKQAQAVAETSTQAATHTPTAQALPAAHKEDQASPAVDAGYATEAYQTAEAGIATDTGYEEQVGYGEDAYCSAEAEYTPAAEYPPEAGHDGAAEHTGEQGTHPEASFSMYPDDYAEHDDAAQVKPKHDRRPAAYDEDLTALGKVHAGWEKTETPASQQKFGQRGPQFKPAFPPRPLYPPRPMYPPQAMFSPQQAMFAAQAGWNQTSFKQNYYPHYPPATPKCPPASPKYPPAKTPVTQSRNTSRAGTPSSTITNEYGYRTQLNDSPKPAAVKAPKSEHSILNILSDKPASTTFPNPAQLKHPSLARLDYSLSSLVEPSSSFESTYKKYSEILQASTKNEREISDLLRSVKKVGQAGMVAKLEGKLVEERERRVRAEEIVSTAESIKEKMEKVAEKVLELDGALWEVVSGVKEALEKDVSE